MHTTKRFMDGAYNQKFLDPHLCQYTMLVKIYIFFFWKFAQERKERSYMGKGIFVSYRAWAYISNKEQVKEIFLTDRG